MATKDFYIKWMPQDWLTDQDLQMCSLEVQGFWVNLLCRMTRMFPYGHLSVLDKQKAADMGYNAEGAPLSGSVNPPDNPPLNGEVNYWEEISVDEQRKMARNIEENLSNLMGLSTEKIKQYLAQLELNNVFSRTDDGIIYSRRLVRDWQKRLTNKKNGQKGGNPNLTGKKKRKTGAKKSGKATKIKSVNPSVNPPDNAAVNGAVNGAVNAGVAQGDKVNNNYNSSSSSTTNSKYLGNSKPLTAAGPADPPKNQNPKATSSASAAPEEAIAGLKGKLLADGQFLDGLLMATGMHKDHVESWIDRFNLNLLAKSQPAKDYPDYKNHFRNWIFKRKEAGEDLHKAAVVPIRQAASSQAPTSSSIAGKYKRGQS